MATEVSLHDLMRQSGFEASLFTTFNIYPPFYEEVILPRLRTAGCRYNVVLADAEQCFAALSSDGSRPRRAGREYVLCPMRSTGAFHPKVMLLAGRSKAAVVVGSHNLTLSGFGYNRELTTIYQFKPTEAGDGRWAARRVWQSIKQWLSGQEQIPAELKNAVLAFRNYAAWLEPESPDAGPSTTNLFAQTAQLKSLWAQVQDTLPKRARRIIILGPFFDRKLAFLSNIVRVYPKVPIFVGVEPETVDLPPEALRTKLVTFKDASALYRESGYLHAKALLFDTGGADDVLIVGSANPSAPAWIGSNGHGNDEAIVVQRGAAARRVAKDLGLDAIAVMPKLSQANWKIIARKKSVQSTTNATGRVLVAEVVDGGFAIPLKALEDAKLKIAEARNLRDDVLLASKEFLKAEPNVVISMPASVCRQTTTLWLQLSTGAQWIALIHQTKEIRDLSRTSKQMQLRAALSGLGSNTADLAKLISTIEKVIFEAPSVTVEAGGGRKAGVRKQAPGASPTGPESLATSMQAINARRHRRLLESGDLAYLLDVLLRQLSIGLERQDTGVDEKGRSEEEQINQDDADDKPKPKPKINDTVLAKMCRGKASHLVKKIGRQMELAARTKSTSPTVLLQLVAVLALLRELRSIERTPRWVRSREILVSREDLERLLDEVLTYLFGRSYQLYQAIISALDDERFDELARMKGLLIWLAWDCQVNLDDRMSISEEPEDVEHRIYDKAALLEFALMLRGDSIAQAEASASILQVADGGAATVGAGWLAKYSRWADRIVNLLDSPVAKYSESDRLRPGDLALITTLKPPRLRVVWGVANDRVSLVDFGEKDLSMEFLRDRVVRVSI